MLIKFVSPPYDMLSYYSVVYLQCLLPTTTVAAFLYLSDKIYLGLKNSTYKSAKYLLSDSMAALVRYSQAQRCLQINSKPLHKVAMKKIYYLTDFSTD